MFYINYYVPLQYHEQVKQALFAIGAGKIGAYDQCCWQVKGESQFRPLQGSSPVTGRVNELSKVEEYKVEMACDDGVIKKAIQTLLAVHPYDQPAYSVYKVITDKGANILDELMY